MNAPLATCAVAVGNTLGESLVWGERRQCLFWTDIPAATLWRHNPATNVTQSWALPERLACLAPYADDDWMLLGFASQLACMCLSTGMLYPLCKVEEGLPTRLNDGACDREGRFVFGTKHEPAAGGAPQALGGWYRLDSDGSLHRLDLPAVAIANGTAFSPDGRTLYFCDSPQRTIQRCAYDEDGRVGTPEVFVDLGAITGVPDGSTVDAEGGLWNAQWGMGRVVRYAPDGREDVVIAMPAPFVTRPAIGGEELDTLYVTSAHEGMTPAERLATPQAGHVFKAHIAQQGLPVARYGGALPAISPT